MFSRISSASFSITQVLAYLVGWSSISFNHKPYFSNLSPEKYDNNLRRTKSVLEYSDVAYIGDRDLFGSSASNSGLALLEELFIDAKISNPIASAEMAMIEFGSVPKFFEAPKIRLRQIGLDSEILIRQIAIIKASLNLYLKPIQYDCFNITSIEKMVKYLIFHHGYLAFEQVRVLYFDSRSFLMTDQITGSGTPTHAPIYAQTIVHQALNLGACGIVLVHNHPSKAELKPSKQDMAVTRHICDVCRHLEISVLDHIIISQNNHYSFRENNIM